MHLKSGRIYQDYNFTYKGFNGHTIQEMVACLDPDNKYTVILIYIRVKEIFYRFFLDDIGFGCLDNWGEKNIDKEESCDYIDILEKFSLGNQKIKKFYCKEEKKGNSKISIEFENKEKLILRKNKTLDIHEIIMENDH